MNGMATFPLLSRVLHWLMAVMILTMLFIGLFMASSVGPDYHRLVTLHRPLGIAILMLAILRVANRLRSSVPTLPEDLPQLLKIGRASCRERV